MLSSLSNEAQICATPMSLDHTDVPNLYSFATKELAQDATIAYILSWAKPQYRESHPRLHQLGTVLLREMLATKDVAIPTIRSLHVEVQVDRIDILARVNDENEDGIVLLVEDKVETHEHSNQIERYTEAASRRYPGRTIVPIYLKTGTASIKNLPSPELCGRLVRIDLLRVLARFSDVPDTIVSNFYTHLRAWEEKSRNFERLPAYLWLGDVDTPDVGEIRNGFYAELERRMNKNGDWGHVEWGYAANQRGGDLWFIFTDETIKRPEHGQVHDISVYAQIENAARLTVRLGNWETTQIRSPLMYEFLQLAQSVSESFLTITVAKAGRFRGGASAAVATIEFEQDGGYLALDAQGVVDMDATLKRLDVAMSFNKEICRRWPNT